MAGEITVTEVNGIQKRVYDSSGMQNVLPNSSICTKRWGWEKGSRKVGESYQVPVVLRPPNGFTYAGSAGGVVTLKQARNMVIKQASITPFEMDLREQMVFAALSRAAQEGEGAFAQLTSTVQLAMRMSAANRLEMAALDGQRGLGEVESVTDNTDQTANVVITAATWAPGRWWAIGQKATLDCFTTVTKKNSAALTTEGLTIASRIVKIGFTGSIGTQINVGDILYFEGAYDGTTFNEMPGAMTQAYVTSGTSPTGISATTYPNWAGNRYAVGGNFSLEVAEDAASQLRDRGASGPLSMYLCNKAYSGVVNDLRQQRVIDSSYTPQKQKMGYRSIVQESPDVGEIEYVNHPFMKQGEFFLCDDSTKARVGSSDLSFKLPGTDGEQFWRLVADTNAAEMGVFADLCVIDKDPSKSMVGTGITYT